MQFSLIYPGERRRFAVLMVIAVTLWALLFVASLGLVLVYLLFIWVGALFVQSAFISTIRGNGVRISAQQFPALAADVEDCCRIVGIERPPEAYLLHADGLFNALATRFLRRHYVVLYSSVVDALEDRPEALRFYIGHELGHIRRGHLSKGLVVAIAAWLPLLGAAYRRACEYTCDRHGLACCPDPDAAFAAMSALAAGGSRHANLDLEVFAAQRHDVKGFWASLNELIGDYPWTAKRAHAILQLARGETPSQPRRHPLAWCFAAFCPRVPGLGGAGALVFVVIIAVAAVFGVQAFQQYQAKAQLTRFIEQTDPDREALTAFALREMEWPSTLDQLGIVSRHSDTAVPATLELGSEGELEYTFAGGRLAGQSLTLNPYPRFDAQDELDGMTWVCMSDTLVPDPVPEHCLGETSP
ncbi:M48 family metallopeptidase [Salinicola sp. JS01]|uniref:M48 family metallopeptidase n=1 Tax=Salinicola sp. JS01 TaxID=3050071 RepID=UPI00255BF033|nr:M48 family metallopeptidase [Salinicola sp. JS01]WIX31838.1 M48 family metallopeptidase [Salinicola sp. JS01]